MKDNKLIADFMGIGHLYPGNTPIDRLQYHTSWDWLMPAVEKISDIKHYTLSSTIEFLSEFYYRNYDNADGLEGKKEFHKAVVEFIKWYNKNKDEKS